SVMDDSKKVAMYINACKAMGIPVLGPDVNKGRGEFAVTGGAIRFGMYAVKGVGPSAADRIIEEREMRGDYDSLESFINRTAGSEVGRRVVENLVKAGAFDALGGNRAQKVIYCNKLIDIAMNDKKSSIAGQMSLFDIADEETKKDYAVTLPDVPEFEPEMLLGFEKEVMGVYISGHPLEKYASLLQKKATATSADFMRTQEDTVAVRDHAKVTIGGMITEKKLHFTKKNQPMAFVTLEDLVGSVEVIVFPNTYEKYRGLIEEDARVFITGRTSVEEDADAKLLAEEVYGFSDLPKKVWVQFAALEEYAAKKDVLFSLLPEEKGKDEVIIYISTTKQKKNLGPKWGVKANEDLIKKLSDAFGEANVRVVV
ncbi:MAG: DNA polymerase III subunit alpha, partial [Lachnospiraceae bacterium]|nr:DNA polymerase III subunit alpha [Lachnospiraceae bacterium]